MYEKINKVSTENKRNVKGNPGYKNQKPQKAQSDQAESKNAEQNNKAAETQKKTKRNTVKSAPKRNTQKKKPPQSNTTPVRATFIGGLNEIGKNVTLYECGDDMFIADCGMAFPDDDMLGIDLVIPDFSYIEKNASRIRGIVLTHGHEDHIGSLPYLLKKVNIPIYGTQLTLGLVEAKLKEHQLLGKCKLNVVKPGQAVGFGSMTVEFIHVNHSIPDAVAFAIHTPEGIIVHTGDYKIDSTPIQGDMIDLGRFAELGRQGVLCLLADSTNAERPGFTMSERTVGESFNKLFQTPAAANRRIIIATFASNIHRIQQIIDYAAKFGRKVAVSGRSMINAVNISTELGYLKVPENILIDMQEINNYPKEKIVLITTGSQGEPMSALSRMASADHRQVAVGSDDFIIISATPIPGNEKTVGNVVNELMRKGCEVVYEKMYDVHVSGHACREELKLMFALTKPKYFIPLHGEQKHLLKHAEVAHVMGLDSKSVIVSDIGDVVEMTRGYMKKVGVVPHGKIMVDGLGVGDVGNIVLRDRKHLGQDGLIIVVTAIDSSDGSIVSGPDIVSRGFVYVREAENLMENAKKLTREILEDCSSQNVREWSSMKTRVKDELSRMLYEKTKRSPMILPVIMEV